MSEIVRPNKNVAPFSSLQLGDERTIFGDLLTQSNLLVDNLNPDFFRGWAVGGDENGFPPQEFFNGLGFTISALVTLLYQKGIAEWDDLQEFYHPAFTKGSDGELYKSKQDSTGEDPVADAAETYWELCIKDATEIVKGIVLKASTAEVLAGVDNIKYVAPDALQDKLAGLTNAQSVSGTVAGSALTVGLSAARLDFRSVDLTEGSYDNIAFGNLSLIVPNGATLGTISTVESELIILAINNSGVVELAIVNLSGGNDLSETGLITTVAIAATADSDNVIYSDSARVDVPYKVVGSARSTQAVAGSWVTAPSLVQGVGGQALLSMSTLGYGQRWQSVTRADGVVYYTGEKPITFQTGLVQATAASVRVSISLDGGTAFAIAAGSLGSGLPHAVGSIVIPARTSYEFSFINVSAWDPQELR